MAAWVFHWQIAFIDRLFTWLDLLILYRVLLNDSCHPVVDLQFESDDWVGGCLLGDKSHKLKVTAINRSVAARYEWNNLAVRTFCSLGRRRRLFIWISNGVTTRRHIAQQPSRTHWLTGAVCSKLTVRCELALNYRANHSESSHRDSDRRLGNFHPVANPHKSNLLNKLCLIYVEEFRGSQSLRGCQRQSDRERDTRKVYAPRADSVNIWGINYLN